MTQSNDGQVRLERVLSLASEHTPAELHEQLVLALSATTLLARALQLEAISAASDVIQAGAVGPIDQQQRDYARDAFADGVGAAQALGGAAAALSLLSSLPVYERRPGRRFLEQAAQIEITGEEVSHD